MQLRVCDKQASVWSWQFQVQRLQFLTIRQLPSSAAVKLRRQTIHPLHTHLQQNFTIISPLIAQFVSEKSNPIYKPESVPQMLCARQHLLAWRDAPQSLLLWTLHIQTWPEDKFLQINFLQHTTTNLSGPKLLLVPFKPCLEHIHSNLHPNESLKLVTWLFWMKRWQVCPWERKAVRSSL